MEKINQRIKVEIDAHLSAYYQRNITELIILAS